MQSSSAQSEVKAPSMTITMKLYHRIRHDIIKGTLAPAQKLKIEELSNIYEVGTSPLREALNLLTSFGFVERLENRGFQVRGISAAEFDDLLKVRCWIEERAVREAIASGDAAWEEEVALALFRLDRISRLRSSDKGESLDWEAHHKQFHMALVAGCGSKMLTEYCEHLYDQNIRYRQIAGLASTTLRDTQAEHHDIAKAILERKPDLAVSLLMTHYHTTGHFLRMKLFAHAEESGAEFG